jgi:hypothetical protein
VDIYCYGSSFFFFFFFFCFLAQQPIADQRRLVLEVSRSHTVAQSVNSSGRGIGPSQNLYLTTHNTHKRQTSMLPAEFKPAIRGRKWPQTLALDRSATGTGLQHLLASAGRLFSVCLYCFFSHSAVIVFPFRTSSIVHVSFSVGFLTLFFSLNCISLTQ